MRTLLIHPPMTFLPYEKPRVVPPLGIAYLASFLDSEAFEVQILDTVGSGWRTMEPVTISDRPMVKVGLTPTQIKKKVSTYHPEIVGITCLSSSQAHNAHEVAKVVKSLDRNVTTVFGGAHPTAIPEKVLRDPNVDFVVIGEGELTLLELVKTIEASTNYSNIKGIAFKKNDEVIINPSRPFIENLDDLPYPSRDLLPMEEYFKAAKGHGAAERKSRFTSMITSRGCPKNCIFCSIHTVWGYKWRRRSSENVLNEIEHLVDKYKVEEIHFEDDNLTLNPKRMKAICDGIIERGLDISWTTPNGVNINTLNKELLKKMRDSGCYWLSFGIEHGDPYFRKKVIGKPVSENHAKRVIKWANELGIWTTGFFIIGLPGETLHTAQKTVDCAKALDLDFASFFIATPYPGTRLYEVALEQGYISKEQDWSTFRVFSPTMDIGTMNKASLKAWLKKANREFYKHRVTKWISPKKIIENMKKIRSYWDVRLVLRLLRYFVSDVLKRGVK